MASRPKKSKASETVSASSYPLPPQLTVEHVEQLASELRQVEAASVSVDASAVEMITTPAMQLLIAFCQGRGGMIREVSPAMMEVAELLGVAAHFEAQPTA